MKKKKHQFHCQSCGSPCEIYKKGKGHRVLICPNCGVLATNPLPLMAVAAAAKGLSLAKTLIGKKKTAEKKETSDKPVVYRDTFDTGERMELALK